MSCCYFTNHILFNMSSPILSETTNILYALSSNIISYSLYYRVILNKLKFTYTVQCTQYALSSIQ